MSRHIDEVIRRAKAWASRGDCRNALQDAAYLAVLASEASIDDYHKANEAIDELRDACACGVMSEAGAARMQRILSAARARGLYRGLTGLGRTRSSGRTRKRRKSRRRRR